MYTKYAYVPDTGTGAKRERTLLIHVGQLERAERGGTQKLLLTFEFCSNIELRLPQLPEISEEIAAVIGILEVGTGACH